MCALKKWHVWSNYLAVNRRKEKIPTNRIDESDMYWNRVRSLIFAIIRSLKRVNSTYKHMSVRCIQQLQLWNTFRLLFEISVRMVLALITAACLYSAWEANEECIKEGKSIKRIVHWTSISLFAPLLLFSSLSSHRHKHIILPCFHQIH